VLNAAYYFHVVNIYDSGLQTLEDIHKSWACIYM